MISRHRARDARPHHPSLTRTLPRALVLGTATLAALTSTTALGACRRGSAETTDSSGASAASAATAAGAAVNAVTLGPENVAVVTTDTIQSGPAISGSLQPERQATIRAEVGGTVVSATVDAGQRVARGQTLARIETTGLTDQTASGRAGVAAAQIAYATAQRNAERANRLLAAGAIAERDAEGARSQAAAARSQLEAARAQLAIAQKQLGNATATAPFSGIVGLKSVSTGDVVAPGAALYTVVDPSSMQLEASVPAEQLGQVRVGATVRFTVTGYPGREFLGRITRVAPVADPATRQVRIIASVPNAGNALVGGLFAEGRVASESRAGMIVPAAAVDARALRPAVVRLKGGRVERVNVELGLRDDAHERIEVRSGVAVGDTLLLGAAQGVSVGTPVRVVVADDRAAVESGTVGAAAGGTASSPSGAPAKGAARTPR